MTNAQGQLGVLDNKLEGRIIKRGEGDHQVTPWMVTLAATVINKGRKDDDSAQEMERERVHDASGRFWRPRGVLAGGICRGEIRRQMDGWSVAGDPCQKRSVNPRIGRRSGESQGLQTETRRRRTLEQRRD